MFLQYKLVLSDRLVSLHAIKISLFSIHFFIYKIYSFIPALGNKVSHLIILYNNLNLIENYDKLFRSIQTPTQYGTLGYFTFWLFASIVEYSQIDHNIFTQMK